MTELTPEQKADRDKTLKKAYQAATARLREEQREAFNTIYADEARKLGVEWQPRKTREDRAREEMDRLLKEFPFLRESVGSAAPEQAPDTGPQYVQSAADPSA